MTAAFAGDDVACRRGGRLVFERVSFHVAEGGALVLSGPNGSGKSSLMRLMAGLARPEAGAISWAGEDVAENPDAHRARLHYVGHHDAVKPALTLVESLAFYAALRGHKSGRDSCLDALDAVGLAHLADQPARFLSQGQRRRTALARLLAAPAPLWLLDEPTLGLDVASVAALEDAIARHRESGGRVVLATHVPLRLPGAGTLALGRPA